jgi:urease accessory protein
LQIWLSPSFPVGAFAYSHGLEKAAELCLVTDRETLTAWLGDLIEAGSLRNDLILTAVAWRAVRGTGWNELAQAAELATALAPSAERNLETTQQGSSFLAQITAAWPSPRVAAALAELATRGIDPAAGAGLAYPIAFALAAAGHDVPLEPALAAYGTAFAGTLVSAAIRLSLVGQTDGQRVIAALAAKITSAAATAEHAALADLGSATLRSDLASLQHETQYSRLFRS